MATKTCPSCMADVPVVASRCKHCMHDFTQKPKSSSGGPLAFLGMLALMAMIGGGVFYYVQGRAAAEKIVIDEETSSVIITKKYADSTETDRIMFDEVAKLELVTGGSAATWEVVLITHGDERKTIRLSDDKSLKGYAEHVASVMDKPLVERSEARGFGDLGKNPGE